MTDRKKKDIHNLKRRFETASINLQNDKIIIQQNKELILKFIRDCRLGKTVKNRQKKVIGEGRCLVYLQQLKRMSFWLNKQFDKVEQVDIEKIIENLNKDKYLSRTKAKNPNRLKQKLLSHSTKVGYKKTLRKFYKWCLGNNTHYPELVDWIDTYDEMKEIPALRREEVEKLADSSKIRDKAIVMFLFDSGVRAEELLNIKIQDLTSMDDIYKVRIVFSKTKRRTIHLPICSRFLLPWLKEYQPIEDNSFLFPIEYCTLSSILRRLGTKLLNKRVTPQIMRHSSVTYYASLINHQQLCYRYGWTMASDMPNRYIDREGLIEKETGNIIKTLDISNLEKENQIFREEIATLKNSQSTVTNQLSLIQKQMEQLIGGKGLVSQILLNLNQDV